MKTLVIANVGNSDIDVSDYGKLRPEWRDQRPSMRALGDVLKEDPQRYAPFIRLPLIGATLRWLLVEQQIPAKDIWLWLCASNQPERYTREEERQKDTGGCADAIRSLLYDSKSFGSLVGGAERGASIPKQQIRVMRITGNPADYSNMLQEYTGKLPEAQQWSGGCEQVFLEVSGGTPAMTSMLIVVGVETFGEQARTLYVDRGADRPYEVGVAQELFARQTRRTLQMQVEMHAYAVALRTLGQKGVLICSDERRRAVLAALLDYADRRLAFDYDGARSALQRARSLTTGETQVYIQFWLSQLEEPTVTDMLAELLHSLRIKYAFGDYADFVQRVFRFQEASFRFMAEQMGIQYSKPNADAYISQQWLDSQPGLRAFTDAYREPNKKQVLKLDFNRSLNRVTLGAIVDYFVKTESRWAKWAGVVVQLHGLSAVADLRNKGLSGHGFEGISQDAIVADYGASIETLLARLVEIFAAIFDAAPGDNPYGQVNGKLTELIGAAVK